LVVCLVAYLGEMDAAGRLGIHQQAAGAIAAAQRGSLRDAEPQSDVLEFAANDSVAAFPTLHAKAVLLRKRRQVAR
jgi:hypothetical protein